MKIYDGTNYNDCVQRAVEIMDTLQEHSRANVMSWDEAAAYVTGAQVWATLAVAAASHRDATAT